MVTSLVIEVEGHGVANEVLGTGFEAKLFIDRCHAVLIKVDS